jgi:hypothetical protein
MRTPADLKAKLRRQWENGSRREARLLGADAWPVTLPIGLPLSKQVHSSFDAVKHHVDAWKRVKVGEVLWKPVQYRAAHAPIDMPQFWKLSRPSEWIEACSDTTMRNEFECLSKLVEHTNSGFHSLFIRRRSLWREKVLEEVLLAARVAMVLEPGAAAGKPLRALSIEGIDTKFFERNNRLIIALLNVRFDNEVGEIGLESFLGALAEGEHWLLVIDLDGELLPFRKLRIRSSELSERMLSGKRLLIVENEKCEHLLPPAPDTVAVLGAGFNLSWTQAEWLSTKNVAYWGDIDTWGLLYLAKARSNIGRVESLLMTSKVYEAFKDAAVIERVTACETPPPGLNRAEENLYKRLLDEPKGRLEQEFISEREVQSAILSWLAE